jgi:hypothetical protein
MLKSFLGSLVKEKLNMVHLYEAIPVKHDTAKNVSFVTLL